MKRSRGRRPRAWIVVLSLMVLGTSCDGKSSPPATRDRTSPSPQRYVSAVCNAVLEWKNVIEVRSSSLVMQDPSLQSAGAYLKGVLEGTDQIVAKVRAVGAPPDPYGPSIQSDVVNGLAGARSALSRVQAELARLVAQSNAALLKEVERPILSAVEAIESVLRNPTSVEMSRATASDTDCHRLFRRKAPVSTGA